MIANYVNHPLKKIIDYLFIYFLRTGETCSHVSAILIKIIRANSQGFTSDTVTDLLQKWGGASSTNVEPAKLEDMKIFERTTLKAPYIPKVSEQNQRIFLRAVSKHEPLTSGLCLFDELNEPFRDYTPVPTKQKLPNTLRDLHNKDYRSIPNLSNYCTAKFALLQITDDEIRFVEKQTRAQSADISWHLQRAGRITGSTVGAVIKSRNNTLSENQILSLTKIKINKTTNEPAAIKYGKANEQNAIDDYNKKLDNEESTSTCNQFTNSHENPIFCNVGFYISKERPYLGASPDGMVICSCCIKPTMIEVKCPFNCREGGIANAVMTDPKFYVQLEGKEYKLSKNHHYYAQVQLQLYVTQSDQCDFIVWSPNDFVVIQLRKDEAFTDQMLEQCKLKFCNAILPELVTRILEDQPDPSACIPADKICTGHCTVPSTSPTIKCMHCGKVYHQTCVQKKRGSKKWSCMICKNMK